MIKNTTIQELKENYSGRHGFIFIGNTNCDPNSCQLVVDVVKKNGYAEVDPEFIFQINSRTFAFVYTEGVSFNCPAFLKTCNQFSVITGAFKVDALSAWLKEN